MKLEINKILGGFYIYVYNCDVGFKFNNSNSAYCCFKQDNLNNYSIAMDIEIYADNLKSLSDFF